MYVMGGATHEAVTRTLLVPGYSPFAYLGEGLSICRSIPFILEIVDYLPHIPLEVYHRTLRLGILLQSLPRRLGFHYPTTKTDDMVDWASLKQIIQKTTFGYTERWPSLRCNEFSQVAMSLLKSIVRINKLPS
jgi:hypothetical protein